MEGVLEDFAFENEQGGGFKFLAKPDPLACASLCSVGFAHLALPRKFYKMLSLFLSWSFVGCNILRWKLALGEDLLS